MADYGAAGRCSLIHYSNQSFFRDQRWGQMVDDSVYSCSWEEFEDWIREQIEEKDFYWKRQPVDLEANRRAIVESILSFKKKKENPAVPRNG